MTTALYLLSSLLGALAFHLASPHQQLWPRLASRRGMLRGLGWTATALGLAIAIVALGTWVGVFAALTAWMLGAVVVPYVDAWRQAKEIRDAG